MQDYRIIQGEMAEMAAVAALEREVFPDPWSIGDFEGCLGLIFPVAKTEVGTLGYAVARAADTEGEILSIGVAPACRKMGVGGALLAYCTNKLAGLGVSDLYLEVRESNKSARNFYRDSGFTIVGNRAGYYRKPRENALILHRKIFPS